MIARGIIASLILLFASVTAVADGGKLEATGAFAEQSASASVREALEATGQRLLLSDGATLGEIWLRKGLSTGAKQDVPGAIYTEIPESTLVGVIVFPKAVSDFRGQGVKAGAYTLRYALHPADGNHMGISPVRDFLVLTPVAVDQEAGASYKFDELMKMSAKTIGANHPAILSLVAPQAAAAPALVEGEHGFLVFASKVKTAAGADLPLAFVVKGVAEQ